ncbi:hypothetical protein SLS62_000902 [Diatrype stigma]|uniref:FAD dependent oxidoreductase domain-containing protein n=1 Tax=Diatrype stigma TaxID=117547 RepID=A0AAN9V0H2_9PEZI
MSAGRAGVIGLSSALVAQSEGHQVTIVARDFPGPFETIDPKTQINYTSPWAGAHNRVVPPTNAAEEREHALNIATFARMRALHARYKVTHEHEHGLTFMKGIEHLEAPGPQYLALTEERAAQMGLEGFRLLGPEELPDDKVKWGCEYDTWCVNPMVYCCFLLRRFVFGGGRVVKREVRDPAEIFAIKELDPVDAVVNASGIGFGDENVFITRGQTCLVADKTCAATITRQNADGSWSFCIPRNFDGGTVIGGTKEPNDWNPDPSPETRARLLQTFAAAFPHVLGNVDELRVIRDIVGRRPTRKGGMRLEKEKIAGGKVVIHAYGLGGRGYELSWGVAESVAKLLAEHLGPSRSSRL